MTAPDSSLALARQWLKKSGIPIGEWGDPEVASLAALIDQVRQERDAEWRKLEHGHERMIYRGYKNGETAGMERAAVLAESLFPRASAHTYGSENADVYHAQEDCCERIAARIRAAATAPAPEDPK